jgi:hypothetical protein
VGVESAADRRAFLATEGFGTVALYQPSNGLERAITGIFDDAHLVSSGSEAGVAGTAPVFTCTADDLALLSLGKAVYDDQMVIDDDIYLVKQIQPDGTGMVMLLLEKQS